MTSKENIEEYIDDDLIDILESEQLITDNFTVRKHSSSLLAKMENSETNDFLVTDFSKYNDDRWVLNERENIRFTEVPDDFIELLKALMYYALPPNDPYGTVKSWKTVLSKKNEMMSLYRYIFDDYKVTPNEKGINLITTLMLNEALDKAKNRGVFSHYQNLYRTLSHWLSISENKLIPSHLRLPLDCKPVINEDRRKDVTNHFISGISPWKAFTEEEIEIMVSYALTWLNEAGDTLNKTKDFILENRLNKNSKDKNGIKQQGYRILDSDSDKEQKFRSIFDKEFAGEHAVGYIVTHNKKKTDKNSPHKVYRWSSKYAEKLDHFRNGVFIFTALITGMRSRELSQVCFSDVTQDSNGDWWLDIRRFKTSIDPNYNGEKDRLPLPEFVAQKIVQLCKLKTALSFQQKQDTVFLSYKSRRQVERKGFTLKIVISDLRNHVNVERIHAHRFRKTIAEILINRSERNIDLIRFLFGHKSYEMTMLYIARNPFMVKNIEDTMAEHFTHDFVDLVARNKGANFSGKHAKSIKETIEKAPESFDGQQIKLSAKDYVTNILASGDSFYIERLSVGEYCLSDREFNLNSLPPCISKQEFLSGVTKPNSFKCQPYCQHLLLSSNAEQAIRENISFFEGLIEATDPLIATDSERHIKRKIAAYKKHLLELSSGDRKNNQYKESSR